MRFATALRVTVEDAHARQARWIYCWGRVLLWYSIIDIDNSSLFLLVRRNTLLRVVAGDTL